MADNNNVPTVPDFGSAPSAEGQNAGGRTHMQTYATTLVANDQILKLENSPDYPIRMHNLKVDLILQMFANIITPLLWSIHRQLGSQTTTAAADVQNITDHAFSIAYDAMFAMYAVLFRKATRTSPSLASILGQAPIALTNEFPVYITALINTIGPIQFDSIPFRGIHVPYFSYADAIAARPANYSASKVMAAIDNLRRIRSVALASVDTFTNNSSPWWTFHCYEATDRNGRNDAGNYIAYSPVRFQSTENALKIAILFAGDKLTQGLGPINYSVTPYYDMQQNPTRQALPAEAFQEPYFILGQPAYYIEFEEFDPNTQNDIEEGVAGSSTGYTPVSPQTQTRAGKKRRRQSVGDVLIAERDHKVLHRAKFLYFDHIATRPTSAVNLSAYTREFNRTAAGQPVPVIQ